MVRYVFIKSFRNLVGILLGPSIWSWFKEDIMLETSEPSVGVIKNDPIIRAWSYAKCIFLENLMEDWISIATLAKQLLKALAMSDGLVIFILNCDSSGKSIYFFIPFHVFIRSLIFSWKLFENYFLEKYSLCCLYLMWASFCIACILCGLPFFTRVFQFIKFWQELLFNRYRTKSYSGLIFKLYFVL